MHYACAILYCHLWAIWLCHIFFPHYLINGLDFGETLLNIKICVLIFCITSKLFSLYEEFSEILLKNAHRSSCRVLLVLFKFRKKKKLEFSSQFFEKYLNTRFHENPFSGNRHVGRRDEANSRFSQFCERV